MADTKRQLNGDDIQQTSRRSKLESTSHAELLPKRQHSIYPDYRRRSRSNKHARHTHTHTHPFNGPFSGTTQVSRYQKGTTNLDFTEARESEWQWHQLGRVQVCTSLQTDNHASTPPLSFLQAGCPSCRPTNSVKALKASNKHARVDPLSSLACQTPSGTVKYSRSV